LVVVLLALLSVWQVNLVSATVDPPPGGDPGSITVHKFHDASGNGVQDEGEEDIEGWLIRIYRSDGTGLYVAAEGYTDSNGMVTFSNQALTCYKVWEQQRDCWEPTTPPGMKLWDGGYYVRVCLSDKNPSAGVEFGNVDTCEPPPPPPPPSPGTGTPGYWKNHPDAWPVDEITIGGVTYTRDAAIEIMNTPEKGDKTYTLFRALVAAKLNVEMGNDSSCIQDTIADADAWMAAHGPVGSDVKAGGKNSPWREGEPLYEKLDDYNNGLLCAPSRG
jgi:hypothetical protein